MSVQPPKVQPKPGQVKVVRALYNYTAQQPDELTFKAGDVLYVYDQISDKDWWKARCGSKSGVIPSNYVALQTESIDVPMHEAARRGNVNFLRECLQQGVSATGLDSVGNTPLHWASRGGHLECVKELLALSSPPVNAQKKALQMMVKLNIDDSVKECFYELGIPTDYGFYVLESVMSIQNKMGDSPLHLAAAHNHLDVLALLLQAGASSAIRNNEGQTCDQLGSAAVVNMLRLSCAPHIRQASYSAQDYVDDSD